MALTPPPSDPAELAAAVALLAAAIGSSGDLAAAERVMRVASVTVEKYAPTAPQAAKDEAVIRMGGFLLGSDYGGVMTEGAADQTVTYASHPVGGSSAFRRSGAMGLLSPWRVRRALYD